MEAVELIKNKKMFLRRARMYVQEAALRTTAPTATAPPPPAHAPAPPPAHAPAPPPAHAPAPPPAPADPANA
ncbi:hypothetical protein MBANPS3_011230 [Mucor bainieri]